jgi:uncharacterized protein with FMN-binding domain
MKRKRMVLLAVLIFVVGAAIAAIAIKSQLERNLEQLVNTTITDIDISKLNDGVYDGSYSTFPVSARVRVIIKDHRITAIELLEHNNGLGSAAEVIPDRVVEAQTLDIDSVSGATYSSRVILKAIENALGGAE